MKTNPNDRVAILKDRVSKLKRTTAQASEDDALLSMGDLKIGTGDNAIVTGNGYMNLLNSDPGMKMDMGSEASTISSGTLNMGMDISKVKYADNKILNPQIKGTPSSPVNYYPTTLTLPPGVAGGLIRGLAAVITGILEVYRQEKESQKVTTSINLLKDTLGT